MPHDNPNPFSDDAPYGSIIIPGNATLLNATDITDADRERAKVLSLRWVHSHDLPAPIVQAAAYERMMCENANEVARLKREAVAKAGASAPVEELPPLDFPIGMSEEWKALWAKAQVDALKPWHFMQIMPAEIIARYDEHEDALKKLRAANATIAQLRARVQELEGQHGTNIA